MRDSGYRKLQMHIPRQRLSRQQPWLIAGFLLVFIVLLIAVYGYFTDKTRSAFRDRRKKINDSVSTWIYNELRVPIIVIRS